MLVRVALAVTCSIAAFSYAQLRIKRDQNHSLSGPENAKELNDDYNKEIYTYSDADSAPKEEEEEEVKQVSIFSPALSGKSFQENDQLLLPELDELFSGGLEFPSDSSADEMRVRRNKNVKSSALANYDDNSKLGEGAEFAKHSSADDNLESRNYDFNSEEDEALEVFEALAASNKISIDEPFRQYAAKPSMCNGKAIESIATNEAELNQLRTLVTELKDKETKLEVELLQYYGLKEQEDSYVELERQLRKKNAEIERLSTRINYLEAQRKQMSEELAGKDNTKKELEAARTKIKELQRQMHSDAGQTKAQLLILKQQVAALKEEEQETSKRDFELEKKLQTLKELEVEVVELRRTSKELQHQKRELTVQLAAAEAKIVELSSLTESDLVARAEAEAAALRHANGDLSRQVEGLQINRFSEVEELVYLRWVNACLRYELRNYKAPPGKFTALDLSKSLSPKSQEKAKQLMLEYAGPDLLALKAKELGDNDFDSISSQPSTPSEFGEFDDSSFDSGRLSASKKSGLMRKLKRWGKSKDDPQISPSASYLDLRNSPSRMSPGHRHSGSKGPLEALMLRNSSDAVAITTFGTNESDAAATWSTGSSHLQSSNSEPGILAVDVPGSLPLTRTRSAAEGIEASSNVAASFQLMSKSVAGILDDKYPAFKDRHKLALAREKAIKEKAEQARAEKLAEKLKITTPVEKVLKAPDKGMKLSEKIKVEKLPEKEVEIVSASERTTERPEVSKLKLSEIEKRAPRVARPPPKPSAGGPSAGNPHAKVPGGGPPVPAPPPPPRPGVPGAPPPPPPPPGSVLKLPDSDGAKVQRAPAVVEFYQSLMRRETRKDSASAGATDVNVADARNNMIGEIENRSTFVLAVKADVEAQGDFVMSLATEVRAATYANIEDVVAFVSWLDEELSFLVDERAVLKHFDWPESKADALREAAFEYQDLKKLESEVSSYKDDPRFPCDSALKKMLSLLEKVEQSVYALLRTRDMAIARYKEFNIPTYWMLDSGLVGKIKLATVQLARKYMGRVASELDTFGASPEKEPLREFLVLQGVRFAFRVHQFAGGFDAESMHTFEDLRNRIHAQSKQQMAEGNTEAS